MIKRVYECVSFNEYNVYIEFFLCHNINYNSDKKNLKDIVVTYGEKCEELLNIFRESVHYFPKSCKTHYIVFKQAILLNPFIQILTHFFNSIECKVLVHYMCFVISDKLSPMNIISILTLWITRSACSLRVS
ncbi:hypothetical protein PHYBLDRAFT_69084 [Phycomyces blakesleeanus NRRL 1555(-)]|uniref:Uncharacterized protein n=1 Tax=Phycomyces blakesleeanus (strain ATCC 8743b / DSM 1359 / FGSC 10004 / NBRC 33097 / NRRL 1555) TaxID=763407 RepID=A0A167J4Z2_PHYB8|nr:hypothetical protein PHYBLDRAFT_69084 [Phycomyces blakesleeanus NRRL 1555(-)]OAD65158.1 hypothetical protein PHYBLDRAFT_69084 [Phycomyces blakesleeanus NRRL 1555(-)]|eukprot:XP_018283198.1 hypothetical protein PHYBLDRAFT_69084 [Phycomyces blakesleeanus NRRL 1555(-)]